MKLNYHTRKREIKRNKQKRKACTIKCASSNNDEPVDGAIIKEILGDNKSSDIEKTASDISINEPSTSSDNIVENKVIHEQLENKCWKMGNINKI